MILSILVSITCMVHGQESKNNQLHFMDTVELGNVWGRFKKALKYRDIHTLHELSLKTVRCDIFQVADINRDYNPFISLDTFLSQFFHAQPKLKLWSVMNTKKYFIRVEQPYRFPQPNIKSKKGKQLVVYEIWYNTITPNEYGDGSEGMQNIFEFVKVGKNYKFFGLSSIP